MARLAEQGFATKTRFARYRVNGMHPEIVALRFKQPDGEAAQMNTRVREIEEASDAGAADPPLRPA